MQKLVAIRMDTRGDSQRVSAYVQRGKTRVRVFWKDIDAAERPHLPEMIQNLEESVQNRSEHYSQV